MLSLFCSGLILASLASIGGYVLEPNTARASFGEALPVFLAQGAVIACAVLMLQNVKLGFLAFLAMQGFETCMAWAVLPDSPGVEDLEVLLPAAKTLLTSFFLFGSWNT